MRSTCATILLTMLALGSPPSLATYGRDILRNKLTIKSSPYQNSTTSRNVTSTTLRPERFTNANDPNSYTVSQQTERKIGFTKSSSIPPYKYLATSTNAQFGDQMDVTTTTRYTKSPTPARGYISALSSAPSSEYQSKEFTSTKHGGYSTSTTTVPYNLPSYQQSDLRNQGLKATHVPSTSTSFPSRLLNTNDVSYASSSGSALLDEKTSTLSTVNADQVVFINRNKGTTRTISSSTETVNVLWNGPSSSASTSTSTSPSTTPFTFSTPSSVNGTTSNGTVIGQIDFKEIITAPVYKCPDNQKRGEDGKCYQIY